MKLDPRLIPEDPVRPPLLRRRRLRRLIGHSDYLRRTIRIHDDAERALSWAARLQEAFEARRVWQRIPAFWFATYGFIPPRGANAPDEAIGFGVVAYSRLAEYAGPETLSLAVDGREFVVSVRGGAHLEPAAPDPVDGTASCWARSSRLPEPGMKVLTAAHIFSPTLDGITLGQRVAMAKGTDGRITDLAPPGIDAVLIDPGITAGTTRVIRTKDLIAPYSPVELNGRMSGILRTRVTSVTETRGILHPYFPIRVFLADPAQGGDSGALVRDDEGLGVGIYTGSLRDLAGRPPEGLCQHLGQVVAAMNLELFDDNN
jgi:hypothetical protein